MTENSVPNPHPTPQPSTPPAVELSWDDIADGNFPPTRQQRLLQAALQATELLKEQPDVPLTQDRLTKALDLVLSNAVLLYPDNTASVNSGSRRYTVANGSCTCTAAKHSGPMCKHQLAVHIHQRAMARGIPGSRRFGPPAHPTELMPACWAQPQQRLGEPPRWPPLPACPAAAPSPGGECPPPADACTCGRDVSHLHSCSCRWPPCSGGCRCSRWRCCRGRAGRRCSARDPGPW